MSQVLEYVTQNYTLFLFGAIIILLAVIGYYADKTNFGQQKRDVSNENQSNSNESAIGDDVESLDSVLDEPIGVIDELNINKENLNVGIQKEEAIQSVDNAEGPNLSNERTTSLANENYVDVRGDELIPNELSIKKIEVKQVEQEDTLQKNEEEFNMFSEEFESLLPKKNIINTDLLSDIDDLELDKTQKIDLSGVPNLGDIELPKIMELSSENEDIWKF